jgi:DNA-binding NarL/FixJ family response regulator
VSARIIIADDHRIVRQGLRALIEKHPDMQVMGEAATGREAVVMVRELLPDIILMDVSMPDMNGIEATRRIKSEYPQIRILALSMHSDRRFAMEMLKAGASGYLLKDSAFEEMAHAIRAVMSGHTYLCHKIADVVIKNYINLTAKQESSAFSELTVREREVLQLIAEGKSTKEIASALEVSVKTVETHRQQMMEKLGVRSVAELTKYAIREGLTSIEE